MQLFSLKSLMCFALLMPAISQANLILNGSFEANNAMHDCDLMICVGARFDDRVTGRVDAFSPKSKKVHIDIDASSINKNVRVNLPIVGDCGLVLEEMVRIWRSKTNQPRTEAIAPWWAPAASSGHSRACVPTRSCTRTCTSATSSR